MNYDKIEDKFDELLDLNHDGAVDAKDAEIASKRIQRSDCLQYISYVCISNVCMYLYLHVCAVVVLSTSVLSYNMPTGGGFIVGFMTGFK